MGMGFQAEQLYDHNIPWCRKQEALKSWISLNKSEKDFFQTKYNEYQSNFRKSVAMHLKNVEPYLKSKVVTPSRRNSSENVINDNINNETKSDNQLMDTKQEIQDNAQYPDQTLDTQNAENTELEIYDNENSQSPIPKSQDEISIPEPTAPKVMTAKELFVIIQERQENGSVWEEMSKQQKQRYTAAVLAIKKNYIKQYRDYLEQLPPKKLFNHYRNIVNSVYHEDWYKKNKF